MTGEYCGCQCAAACVEVQINQPLPKSTNENSRNARIYPSGFQADSPANVTYKPGIRNDWHRHPGAQTLLVTGGRGWIQQEGKNPYELQEGDAVMIPGNVAHWHGAARDSWFSHVTIETDAKAGMTQWLAPVSDEAYKRLK